MSIDSTPPEFATALAGQHTPPFSPPSITRQGLMNHDIRVRLSMSRRPASEQYESPLIGGDELHFSASAWSGPIYKERIHVPTHEIESQIEALLGPEAAAHILTFGDTFDDESGGIFTAHRFLLARADGAFFTPSLMQVSTMQRAFGRTGDRPAQPLARIAPR